MVANMGYFIDLLIFGKDRANLIWSGRFLFGLTLFSIVGIGAIIWGCKTIYKELALELRYHHQYGASWKTEYERTYGSLSDEHIRLIVAVSCLIALATFLGWAGWRFLQKHGRHHQAGRRQPMA